MVDAQTQDTDYQVPVPSPAAGAESISLYGKLCTNTNTVIRFGPSLVVGLAGINAQSSVSSENVYLCPMTGVSDP